MNDKEPAKTLGFRRDRIGFVGIYRLQHRLRSYRVLCVMWKPIPQNPLSGECGIMAIVNAMRSLVPEVYGGPLTYEALKPCERLYCHLFTSMSCVKVKSFIQDGSDTIDTLIRAAALYTSREYGIIVRPRRQHKTMIKSPNLRLPVQQKFIWIVGLEDHWSVIHDHDDVCFSFYDSYQPDLLVKQSRASVLKEIEKLYTIEHGEYVHCPVVTAKKNLY